MPEIIRGRGAVASNAFGTRQAKKARFSGGRVSKKVFIGKIYTFEKCHSLLLCSKNLALRPWKPRRFSGSGGNYRFSAGAS
jgi:hypothetical protein